MSSTPVPARLLFLDAFRGLVIAGMVLVNNPGTWKTVYTPLLHADWDGWTPTDLVFPFFLFIAGFAFALSLARRREAGKARQTWKLLRRSLLLVLTGLLLSGFPDYAFETLRYPGVLQRIGLCALVAGLIEIHLPLVWRYVAVLSGIVLYHFVMHHLVVPGHGAGVLTPEGNGGAWIDRMLLGTQHLWKQAAFDPEGLVSTLPAVLTMFLGVRAGSFLVSRPRTTLPLGSWAAYGVLLVIGGLLLDRVHQPINKPLWSPAYAVFTAGCASLGLVLIASVMRWRPLARILHPMVAFGRNPLLLFVLSGVVARLLGRIRTAEGSRSLKQALYEDVFLHIADGKAASLLFALAFVLVFTALALVLDRLRVYVKL